MESGSPWIRLLGYNDADERIWLRDRLFREDRAAGSLSHPSIVSGGQLGGGQLPPATLDADQAMDALVDVIVQKYAPLPERSLRKLIVMLRGGAQQWEGLRMAAFARARVRLGQSTIGGTTWYWPIGESPSASRHSSAQDEDRKSVV